MHDFHFSAGRGTNHLFIPTVLFLCSITLSHVGHRTVLLYVTQVPRHAGPTFTGPDITKGHPNLAGTPPGHAHSPALSQVSVPTASPYRYPKGWETGGGVSFLLWLSSSSLHFYCWSFFLSLASIRLSGLVVSVFNTCYVSCFANIYLLNLLFIPKHFQVLLSV